MNVQDFFIVWQDKGISSTSFPGSHTRTAGTAYT